MSLMEYKEARYTTRKTCRVCNFAELTPLYSLGTQFVSDFVPENQVHSGHEVPIDIVMCQTCGLVQQKHTAPQELLYTRKYWYHSSVTSTMRKALKDVTEAVGRVVELKEGDIVIDLGSNDGTLLRSYERPGLVKVGVEPAANLKEEGSKGVDHFINDFWSYHTYLQTILERQRKNARPKLAKAITAIGMLYDLENPHQFIRDVSLALADDGVFVCQLMCLKNMLDVSDIGNFVHEHLEFYPLKSLDRLFCQYGLEIFDIETNDVNGRSYRIYARRDGRKVRGLEGAEQRLAKAREDEGHLNLKSTYDQFFERMEQNRDTTVSFIKQQVAKGKRVWILGASTKGSTIIQWYGLDHSLIEGASDRTPDKHGLWTVGSGIPIFGEEEARKAKPDFFLVLPFAFLSELVEREKVWRDNGGRFLVPLPEFKVV